MKLQRIWSLAALLLLSACAHTVDLGTAPAQPAASAAQALPWQQRTPALAYLRYAPLKDSVVHALRVDLQAYGVQVLVTPPVERGQAMPEMATVVDSLAGLNASFFSSDFVPLGLTVSNGETWLPLRDGPGTPLLACDSQPRCVIELHPPIEPKPAWRTVVAGTPWLLDEGRLRTATDDAGCEHLCAKTHPRSAVGIDASGRYLFLVAAEGRRPPVQGLTLAQLSAVMQQLGARNALNLDGGGSTTMMLQGRSLVERPLNEPELRPVANALLIRELAPIKAR